MPSLFTAQIDFNSHNEKNTFDNENRITEIIEYFLERIDPTEEDQIFIMDPYFDFDSSIYKPLYKRELTNDNWENFISLFCSFIKKGSFRILTEKENKEHYASKVFNNKNPKILNANHPNHTECIIEVVRYVKPTAVPNTLHDRWLLVNKKAGNQIGFHIGPSLSDIHNKDALITRINEETVLLMLQRFKEIWKIFTKEEI